MKIAVLLCLVSIGAVVLAKPNPLSEDDDYLKELHAAVFGVHQNETITPKVEDSDRANHTSEEVDYSHSYEHDDYLEELHAAVFGVRRNETITPIVEDSVRVNHTSEEVDYSHSYEHDDHHHQDDDDDGDDFSHEDCDHSEESVESEERHSTPLPQEDIHSSIIEQGTWIEH